LRIRAEARDGYYQHLDIVRKLFNKAVTKKEKGKKGPPDFNSSLGLDDVFVKWRAQDGKGLDLS